MTLKLRILTTLRQLRLVEWLVIVAIVVVLIALLLPPVQWAASGDIEIPVRVIVFDADRGVPIPNAQVLIIRSLPAEVESFMANLHERLPSQFSDSPESDRGVTDSHGIARFPYRFRTGSGNQHPIPSAHLAFYWVAVRAPGYGGSVTPVRHESVPNSVLREQGELVISVGLFPTVGSP